MAYYYGNDPASQYNQSDANGIQARQLRSRRLQRALGAEQPVSGTQEEPERVQLETPEAPTTAAGTQRMIRPLHAALGGQNRNVARSPVETDNQASSGASTTDLFNTLGSGASAGSTATTPAPTTPTKPTYDSSQWDTDGWGTPQYLGKAAGGAMAGWNQENWDNQNMQTPKYVVGRILSNYTPSMEGLGQAMQEIQQAYPGAEFDGKDKVTIPGLGVIDVLVNAGGDNMSWAWQDQTNDPQANGPLMQALGQGTEAISNPIAALLEGLDPSVLQNPQWRQMLASLGVQV